MFGIMGKCDEQDKLFVFPYAVHNVTVCNESQYGPLTRIQRRYNTL